MGTEVAKSRFSAAEFEEFKLHLEKETALVARWFREGVFKDVGRTVGLELETVLVDSDFRPTPENGKLLEALNDPMVVPELSRFNVEMNTPPFFLEGHCLTNLYKSLQDTWFQVRDCARDLDIKMMMIGTLPTMQPDMLVLEYMSEMERYRALNEQILSLRQEKDYVFEIHGRESIKLALEDVMLESAGTALQIHIQVEPDATVRHFNAGLIASAATVAIAANSPYLFGKDLWEETRIPIFEESIKVPGFHDKGGETVRRVTFGSGYVRDSIAECFLENLEAYPVILPMLYEQGHEWLSHLRLHNGTIWRWNRPIIGMSKKGEPHIRFEHRVPATGPTLVDAIANLAFSVGLVRALAMQETPPESQLSFDVVRSNFYQAAQYGLAAKVEWIGRKQVDLQSLIIHELLPMVREGLHSLEIAESDISLFIDKVLEPRILSGQTGSYWQRSFVSTHGRDFQALAARYFEMQETDMPVHEWKV